MKDNIWAHLLGYYWDWKKRAVALLVLALLVGIGLIAGYFAGDALASNEAAAAKRAPRALPQGAGSTWRQLAGLPGLGSEQAAALLADDDTPDIVRQLYVFANDTATINKDIVVRFLRALKAAAEARQLPAGSGSSSSSLDIEPFIPLAGDLLSYFRTAFSAALLPLLRLYAASGGTQLALTAVSPDLLQQEVARLLNSSSLNAYYTSTASGCGTRPVAGTAAGSSLPGSGLQTGRRRRLSVAKAGSSSSRRRLQQGSNTAQDMVCSVQRYLPPGVQQLADCPAAVVAASSRQPGFTPVAIPVVIHCLGFMWPLSDSADPAASVYLPQLVGGGPQDAARNLIDAANVYYQGTGIQFKLQAVRHDASQHTYLNLGTMQDWQRCSPHSNKELNEAGMACLQRLALAPSVARLASRHVINVFVSGSNRDNYCSQGEEVCTHSLQGLSNADGPWWNAAYADKSWREGDSGRNWVWLRWTHLDPADYNRPKEYQRGGAVLAHELGHYLGLLHTHEGLCQGDQPSQGDEVPDTAPCMTLGQLQQAMEPVPLNMQLQTWCIAFRDGEQPAAADLETFNSCPTPPPGQHATDAQIDAVFNLMSYLPAACSMVMTPGQVVRLQQVISRYRPLMMAAHPAK